MSLSKSYNYTAIPSKGYYAVIAAQATVLLRPVLLMGNQGCAGAGFAELIGLSFQSDREYGKTFLDKLKRCLATIIAGPLPGLTAARSLVLGTFGPLLATYLSSPLVISAGW
jgi:hypothetical protein